MKSKVSFNAGFLIIIFVFVPLLVNAQFNIHPYSYQFYQKFDRLNYSVDSRYHTAVKPYVDDSLKNDFYESFIGINEIQKDSWFTERFLQQHFIELENSRSKLTIDVLPDFIVGKGLFQEVRKPYLGSLGLSVNATAGDKLSFHLSGYTSHAVLPNHIQENINENGVIPGFQDGKVNERRQSWEDFTAHVNYDANEYLDISLSYGKNFIGDGYRSMLLSDVSSNYTSLKLIGKLGNVQYMSMWSHMLDPSAPSLIGNKMRGKWGAFQYLDWNVSNRVSIGFFQSIIWANRLETEVRGFEFAYLNPLVFLRPIESSDPGSPDKMHLGVNAKYKVAKNMTFYGQFLLGEFTAKEFFSKKGYIHNKWGVQAGVKSFDVFKVKNLNFLAEFNAARPYTYTHYETLSNYSNYHQPLAHPLGANFKEVISVINYSHNKFDFSLKGAYALTGMDHDDNVNYGQNIFKTYKGYENKFGNFIGQGLKTKITHFDASVAYVLNPKTNLRVELGSNVYFKTDDLKTNKSLHIFFGLRSAFRNIYTDY